MVKFSEITEKEWIKEVSLLESENATATHLYIKIGRFVCPTGSVSECRTAGMPIMSHCQPYATMQHCAHAAYFDRRHLARSALRPCPTTYMRECLHRCVRWEDEEVAGRLQRAAYRAMSTLREKGEEEEGRTPVAAAFTKLRAWPSVCVVLCYLITSYWQIPSGCTAHATPSHNRAKCDCGLWNW